RHDRGWRRSGRVTLRNAHASPALRKVAVQVLPGVGRPVRLVAISGRVFVSVCRNAWESAFFLDSRQGGTLPRRPASGGPDATDAVPLPPRSILCPLGRRGGPGEPMPPRLPCRGRRLRRHNPPPAGVQAAVHPGVQADRKSTRLNSSHVSISYAVFCLKKKKK